jgi:uncharacterized protein (TIGR02597 family)
VVSVTANSIQLDVPHIVDGQFSPTATASYYLQIKTGDLEGLMFRVNASTGGQFRLDTRDADLLNHPLGSIALGSSGELACIRRLMTIKEIFGTGATVALLPVSSVTLGAYQGGDEIFVPSDSGMMGIGQPRISYLAGSGWRRSGDAGNDSGNVTLFPGAAFVVRKGPTQAAELFVTGYVPYGRFAVELPATKVGEVADVHIGLVVANEVSLQASGLLTGSGDSSPLRSSTDSGTPADALLSWADVRSGMDRPPDRRYSAVADTWYEAGNVADLETLKPGAGYVLRLREGRSKRFWVQTSTY